MTEELISFIDETTIKGYDTLTTTSESYETTVQKLGNLLMALSNKCEQLTVNINEIEDAVSAVNIAVEESAKGITQVTESAVDLSGSIIDINAVAQESKNIAHIIDDNVNKFVYK